MYTDGTAAYSTNTAELLFYAAIPVLLYCCCPVVLVGSLGFAVLKANACRTTW